MLLYLLKVLLHMEQANCIGPTRIWAGVGIQNLLSWLKEQPWKLLLEGSSSSSSLTWKIIFSSSSSSTTTWSWCLLALSGKPMCKATVTCSSFSSFTSKLCRWWCSSSFEAFSVKMGKNWMVSWVKEKEEEEEEEEEEDGLSHSMKVGAWRYRFLLFSTLHSIKPLLDSENFLLLLKRVMLCCYVCVCMFRLYGRKPALIIWFD